MEGLFSKGSRPDPSQFSILAPTKFTKEKNVKDIDETRKDDRPGDYVPPKEFTDERGEKFYKVGKNGPKQMLVALMLKGVINVSDIVAREENEKWQYYSRLLPTRNIKGTLSNRETKAEMFILGELFHDKDHFLPAGNVNRSPFRLFSGGRAVAHFDFEGANFEPIGHSARLYEISKQVDKKHAVEVAMRLHKSLEGDGGMRWLTAIVKKIPESLILSSLRRVGGPEDQAAIRELQSLMLSNISFFVRAITTKPNKEEKAAWKEYKQYLTSMDG